MRPSSGRRWQAAILVCSQIHLPFEETAMRPAIAASALSLCLVLLAAQGATPQAPASTPAATTPTAQIANDDAAKHAKRTACLKDAKSRKLIGADKTAFLKTCTEAPPGAISASRVDRP
jgi:hypothetical protein